MVTPNIVWGRNNIWVCTLLQWLVHSHMLGKHFTLTFGLFPVPSTIHFLYYQNYSFLIKRFLRLER